ncbi:MAG: poly(3-hydroxyalkanoate) depolymerase [Burkholderiales bacterium]|nr:poly(3-hydroxyalkanoate) depolymerase [Burkholderiales bacterium]
MPARSVPAAAPIEDTVAAFHHGDHPYAIEMLHIGSQLVRVGRQAGRSRGGLPLLLFNGIGGNIELLGPIASWMPGREVITFDIPGVGHSPLPSLPYRMKGVARLAAAVLDHYGHAQADVLGVSWGGAAAQQFARSQAARCRRLILCATATGMFMVPARPSVLLKMATPRRYMSKSYAKSISGDIYGGDYRRDPELAARHFKHIKWQSRLGYYLQIAAGTGWTSVHWLHRLPQPTLVMAGDNDPLIPLVNARLLHQLIPHSELQVFDCGHLFLMTRPQACARAINEFLDRP